MLSLLRLHVEATWYVQLPIIEQPDIELLPESPFPTWKLCVADIVDRHIYIWRPDIQLEEREALRLQAGNSVATSSISSTPLKIHREVAFSNTITSRIDVDIARRIAHPLTEDDSQRIEEFEADASTYYLHPAKRPLIGIIVDNQIVCIAHSSRRTSEACELGIDTLPHARRKGYALAATVLWTQLVQQEGLVPIYSAFAENIASLKLAEAAGYRPFTHITTVGNS